MDNNQIQLIIQEKNLALEQCSQNTLLIEKLEQELQTLRDLQPTSNKNILNIIQKEYTEVISVLRDKLKTIQDKYKEEISNSAKKDGEIIILTKRTDELSYKLEHLEREYISCNNLLKQEREKYLSLENDFIRLQKESFSLEKKYSCVRILENEQNKLASENYKLSNDCNELEVALEICHQKMRSYEEDLNLYCKCLKQIEQEKEAMENNGKLEKEHNNDLEKRLGEMNATLRKLQSKLENKDELFRKNIEHLVEYFSMDNSLQEFSNNSYDEHIEENTFSMAEFSKLQVLLSNYRKKLKDYAEEKYDLEMKLGITISNMEKYKKYIEEANDMISRLEKKLNEQEKIIKNKTSKKNIEKYVQKIGSTNVELQKQIHSQEELHQKWKSEVTELINRFKNRIALLNASYKKSQKENIKLKKFFNKYLSNNNMCKGDNSL